MSEDDFAYKIDALELVLIALKEHEKNLDLSIEKLRTIEDERELLVDLATIRECLLYALKCSCNDLTTCRLIVQEFYNSLNRRKVIDNITTENLVSSSLKRL